MGGFPAPKQGTEPCRRLPAACYTASADIGTAGAGGAGPETALRTGTHQLVEARRGKGDQVRVVARTGAGIQAPQVPAGRRRAALPSPGPVRVKVRGGPSRGSLERGFGGKSIRVALRPAPAFPAWLAVVGRSPAAGRRREAQEGAAAVWCRGRYTSQAQ